MSESFSEFKKRYGITWPTPTLTTNYLSGKNRCTVCHKGDIINTKNRERIENSWYTVYKEYCSNVMCLFHRTDTQKSYGF